MEEVFIKKVVKKTRLEQLVERWSELLAKTNEELDVVLKEIRNNVAMPE